MSTPDIEEAERNTGGEGEDSLFGALFHLSPLPTWIVDAVDYRFLEVNDRACDVYAFNRDEMLAMRVTDLRPHDARDTVDRDAHALRQGVIGIRRTHVRKDGLQIEVELSAREIVYQGEAALLVQAMDVTRRERAEIALRESGEALNKVLDAVLDAVIVVDDAGRIADWRGASQSVFGWTREEVLGRSFAELIVPERHRATVAWGLARYVRGQGTKLQRRTELEALDRHGVEFPIDLAISVIRAGGRTLFAAFVRDLRERKAAEAEILSLNSDLERRVDERTEELRRAYRDMEEFSYSMAHDLRAPLRAIMSSSMVLLHDHGPRLGDDARKELRRQADAAKRVSGMIDNLLEFARVGRMTPKLVKTDLTALAREVAAGVEKSTGVAMNVTVEPGLTAQADAELIRIVLLNLFENSVKYGPEEGSTLIHFGRSAPASGEAFYVADNGIGFEMQYADKLFKPFERLHRPTEYSGSGIGLANVKRIIERHGGKVWAQGNPGKGATFFFTLPE